MKKFYLLLILAATMQNITSQNYKYPFQNPGLDLEERVLDLVSRMTLDEKVAQMLYTAPAIEHLGVPSYNWWNECLHGVARAGQATVFPQGIGLAATFDDDLMFRIADAIGDEARAKHHDFVRQGKRNIYQGLTFWTPNINIFRDPRWGRGQETYGEDPFLTAKLAVPFVNGLQGNDSRYLKAVATVKHFAVHSGPEPLRHKFDAQTSDKDLAETYLYAFKEVVERTNLESVMCAYNRFRGEACCGSTELLQTYLRDQWGFKGYVVSDCGAIRDFYSDHHVSADAAEASALAVRRGTDLNCGTVYGALGDAVRKGLITEKEIDQAVIRLFRARFKLGMFDPDGMVEYAQIPMSEVNNPEKQELALEAARKSVVLLKNNGLLPLKKNIRNIAVIGPTANDDETLWGNYCGYNKVEVTVLKGIRDKLPQANVNYEVGCELSENFPQLEPVPAEYLFQDKTGQKKGVRSAYYNNPNLWGNPRHEVVEDDINHVWWDQAPYADIPADNFGAKFETCIRIPEKGKYALGIEGFYGYKFYINDSLVFTFGNVHHPRKKFHLRDCQKDEMVKISIDYRHEKVNHALLKLLWGRSDNQVLMKRARYSNMAVPAEVSTNGTIEVKVDVKNTGKMDGDEIVQLYISHKSLPFETPIRALKGFKRVHLKKGETKTVAFNLAPEDMAVVNEEGRTLILPGEVEISVGGKQPDNLLLNKLSVSKRRINLVGEAINL